MLTFLNLSAYGGSTMRAAVVSVAVWTCTVATAEAQGLLDLFFGAPKPQHVMPMPMPQQRQLKPAVGIPSASLSEHAKRAASDTGVGERASGTYRTVCVRMCDGAFVPMSYATTKSNFQHDQNKCRASCGESARLFFHRNPGGAMEDAIDLSGRVYGSLPTAFKFRKTLVEGCSCRPPPWSEAELARHRAYAMGPQSPIPGQPLPQVAGLSSKVVVALPATEPAAATLTEATAPALPLAQKNKAASRVRDVAPETPRVIKIAAQRPVAAPVIIKVASPQPKGGLFGFSAQTGMGLTGQPKFKWPGD
jgi:Protein of unknown function (DUF2865)